MLKSSPIAAFAAATDLHPVRAFYEPVPGLSVADHSDFAGVLDATGTVLASSRSPRSAGLAAPSWVVGC